LQVLRASCDEFFSLKLAVLGIACWPLADVAPLPFLSHFQILQRVDVALGPLLGGDNDAAHSLTIEVVGGWGGAYVQSCAINGAPLPAAIVPHDVLQVKSANHYPAHVIRYLT
jgi:hypothetical protein